MQDIKMISLSMKSIPWLQSQNVNQVMYLHSPFLTAVILPKSAFLAVANTW